MISFVAGFGPITHDTTASRALYEQTFGIPFDATPDGYYHTQKLPGTKYFALWPLAQAAESCFGTSEWPADIPLPQAWLEFEVADVEAASSELERKGYRLLVRNRTEPWGQVVTRLLSPEGILTGVVYTPMFHDEK